MDGTTHLLRQLDQFLVDADGHSAQLSRSLDVLVRSLGAAIPSFSGLILHVSRHGHPVTLTAFPAPDKRPVTSLRWTTPHPRSHGEASLTLYARHAGAFLDLAADLGYLTQGRLPLHDRRRSDNLIRLDRDLPPPTRASAITGIEELTTINRATGVLIDRGAHPQQAMRELARHAAAAGLNPYTYACTLLGHVVNPSDT